MSAILWPMVLLGSSVHAAAPVVDLGNRNVSVTPAQVGVSQSPAYVQQQATQSQDALGILFSQIQALQQEVQMLRGQLEQQQNELQQLKQQQKDNYLDTDRRLSELQQQAANAVPGVAPISAPAVLPPASTAPVDQALEKKSYDQAYELLNANQKDAAILAFRKHLINYPKGNLAANSYYWLGQIYLSQANLTEAENQFSVLLKQFPQHAKTNDARFSLGKVYYQQGKKEQARKTITEVSKTDGPAGALARDFLKNNF